MKEGRKGIDRWKLSFPFPIQSKYLSVSIILQVTSTINGGYQNIFQQQDKQNICMNVVYAQYSSLPSFPKMPLDKGLECSSCLFLVMLNGIQVGSGIRKTAFKCWLRLVFHWALEPIVGFCRAGSFTWERPAGGVTGLRKWKATKALDSCLNI